MKTAYVFLALLLCILPTQLQAQSDALVVAPLGDVGVGTARAAVFSSDLVEYGADRFDANGDGVAEFVSLEVDENNRPIKMRVQSIVWDSFLYVVDLQPIRDALASEGADPDDVNALRFERFLRLTNAPYAVPLFSANHGIIVYYPSDGSITTFPPHVWKLYAVTDFDEDGWPELILRDKQRKVVEMYVSRYAPGMQ